MTKSVQNSRTICGNMLRNHLGAIALACALMAAPSLQAQTLTVLHSFARLADGATPLAGLTMDRSGNLFGTSSEGGLACGFRGCGTVFEMTQKNSVWVFTPLYAFTGFADGENPASRITIGPNGTLYGTTLYGDGTPANGGVVFSLQPPPHTANRTDPPWRETVLYTFGNPPDGDNPWGEIVFDQQGNLYGTTVGGGVICASGYYCGTVYELTPHSGSWTESILYTFTQSDFSMPRSGVIFDSHGNLYGTATNGNGQVFRLTSSGPSWLLNTIYAFQGGANGSAPAGNVIFDSLGNMYGTTVYGGANGEGTVFELMSEGGRWIDRVIYNLGGDGGSQPSGGLAWDSAGNLYGVTCSGGVANQGAVYKLTPSGNGQWTETTLHEFTGSDGSCPQGRVVLDASGNIYGTTMSGGQHGIGVVFEITP
jgi:uncharacterized repeat protein (TIGR03803 family)